MGEAARKAPGSGGASPYPELRPTCAGAFPRRPRLRRQPPIDESFQSLIICEVIGNRQTEKARRENAAPWIGRR
jgi:hypothetical protein